IDNKKLSFHDCSDAAIDVSRAVKCLCPSVPNNDVIVEAQDASDKTKNTTALLERCYNENNTGIRGISRELLHDKLFEHYGNFINYWLILHSRNTLQLERDNAKEHLANMISDKYPFSVFWKWHIRSDNFLAPMFPNI
ncbi:MAG: hypothetical protein LBV31_03695, partial [Prevotellaceae bacterium]|nr:hypothetical protein [Prevotellaceae bacterium]